MDDDQITNNEFCRQCGCSAAQAMADARALGFEDEFHGGTYSCCQIAQWAKEQLVAWLEAAREEQQNARNVQAARDMSESEEHLLPVRMRRQFNENWT